MNSIWLVLLLLFCCNGDNGFGRSGCGCDNDRNHDCGCNSDRTRDCGCDNDRNRDCGCNDADYDYDMRISPFSPLNRRERAESDYSTFRGNNGPCGCEENND